MGDLIRLPAAIGRDAVEQPEPFGVLSVAVRKGGPRSGYAVEDVPASALIGVAEGVYPIIGEMAPVLRGLVADWLEENTHWKRDQEWREAVDAIRRKQESDDE